MGAEGPDWPQGDPGSYRHQDHQDDGYLDFQTRKNELIEFRFMDLVTGDWEAGQNVQFTLPVTQQKSHKLLAEPLAA